jgi:hypothetical protein
MKHTYLYTYSGPVRAWLEVRMDPADRGETSDIYAPDSEWVAHSRAYDARSVAYEALMESIKEAPRVCIGRRYVIPGSKNPDIHFFEEGVSESTRKVTVDLWDGPVMMPELRRRIMDRLTVCERDDSCDPLAEINRFLIRSTGRRVIPVWM